ncbi:uncharacterized protein LOC129886338 isoform X2 [Solanum dulcamara]|uniref:uncharacterized protein LOC129886338 isoform X2 n=1 Tax=Solanum dulcamara TaxID=45834 RepID=UPI00248645C9|nr:uncharacterized protein LOC129886338 isoform X2 [Solanum dulcamara]
MEAENLWPKSPPLSKAQEKAKRFLEAACEGDIELFKKLAKERDHGKGMVATVASVKDGKERGALIFAAAEGKIELCKYLVEELKIDVNQRDKEGQTPVLHAARQGHTATVQYLIEQGADPKTSNASGTALHNAAVNGHIKLVKLLLSKGVDIDLQSDVGTPLICAASHGQEDAVKVLLEHHANFDAQTEDDNLCSLVSAVAANSLRCVELLVKAGANVNVKAGDATRYGETTPLLVAARKGNAEIINFLLQAGADPNAADEDGNKPIHVAATSGSREAVEALFAVTPRIQSVPEWSVDGVIEFMQSEYRRKQERTEAGRQANNGPKKDLPEVNPEAKKKAADANARGFEAFKMNDFATAIDAYTQAINSDPTDGTLFSNRSLCRLCLTEAKHALGQAEHALGQAKHALSDAKACKKLRPDWAEAYYRQGAALRVLQRFSEAANAFYRGIQIDPENKDLLTALRETVESMDGRE